MVAENVGLGLALGVAGVVSTASEYHHFMERLGLFLLFSSIVVLFVVYIISPSSLDGSPPKSTSSEGFAAERIGPGCDCTESFIGDLFDSNGNLKNVCNRADGSCYNVQTMVGGKKLTPEQYEEASHKLGQINLFIQKMIDLLKQNQGSDPRTQRIASRYNPSVLREGTPFNPNKDTTYVTDKGKEFVVCLRPTYAPQQTHQLNLLQFVILHELSHLASVGFGHGAEFQKNFLWLLESAKQYGIYNPVDYGMNPVEYCGIRVNSSPLFD